MCHPHVDLESRVRRDRGVDARAAHRREHDDVQRGERDVVAAELSRLARVESRALLNSRYVLLRLMLPQFADTVHAEKSIRLNLEIASTFRYQVECRFECPTVAAPGKRSDRFGAHRLISRPWTPSGAALTLGCEAFVAMVQPVHLRHGDDSATRLP